MRPSTASPSKAAWGRYLAAREKLDSRGMNAACRELSQALIPLLRDPAPFKGPDLKLEEPLRLAYVELRAMATHCASGNSGPGPAPAPNYVIAASNSFGPIVSVVGVGDIVATANANHPWANFSY